MASIVVTGLLYVVVELLRIDRRELALEEVQGNMQRAMDYIADDLREAVYVYPTPTVITNQLDDLNGELTGDDVPVLAFWRPDPIDANLPADCSTEGANEEECTLLKARRATYSLVVYYQRAQYGVWEGQSVIKRYELNQYVDLGTDYTETDGYADPITATGTNFETWTKAAGETADGVSSVLVDYVDELLPAAAAGSEVDCQALINQSNSQLTTAAVADEYVLVPSTADPGTSFFACVRDPNPSDPLAEANSRAGQDVYVFLRGDAGAAAANVQPASEASRLPTLETQVLVRGVINKDALD